jgi:hypothetical protein
MPKAQAAEAPQFVNIGQASRLIGVGGSSIRGWILAGKLPATRAGWNWKIRVSDLYRANEESLAGAGAKQRARRKAGSNGGVPEGVDDAA